MTLVLHVIAKLYSSRYQELLLAQNLTVKVDQWVMSKNYRGACAGYPDRQALQTSLAANQRLKFPWSCTCMNRVIQFMQVGVLEVYGANSVQRAWTGTINLDCLHFEVQALDVHIQFGDIEDQSVGPVCF